MKGPAKKAALAAAQSGDLAGLIAAAALHGEAALECHDGDDCQPLHRAAAAGRLDVVRWLLDGGIDPDCRKSKYKTPLHEAAAGGHLQV